MFYTPVKYTDWMMITVVPWQSIDTLGMANGLLLLIFFVVVMLVIVVICYYCMKRVTGPLSQLAKAANDIADRKFDTPLPEVKYDDEIRQLCDSFEHIQESLPNFIHK